MDKNVSIPADAPYIQVKYDKNGKMISKEAHNLENISIPEFELKQLCRCIIKGCEEFYSDPENVKRFEKWKAEREANKKHNLL